MKERCPVCTALRVCVQMIHMQLALTYMTITSNEANSALLFKDCTKPSTEPGPSFHQQPYFSKRNSTQVIYITETRMINLMLTQ